MTRTMRSLVAAAALLGAMPAAASADTVTGTVIARDAQRGTIITSGRTGGVATLRVVRAAAFKPGQRVRASATALGDGTYRAAAVKRRGRAGAAKARFTLVRRAGREYVVSAGGSTFALRAGSGSGVSTAGAVVTAKLRVAKGKAAVAKAKQVGQATTVELDGRFAGVGGGVVRLAVGAQDALAVAVPAGVQPALETGAEVELLSAVGADGSLTLLAVDGQIEAYGVIAAVSATSITVGAVTCAVPEDLDVSDLVVGAAAGLVCVVADGVLTADEVELDEFGIGEDDWYEEDPADEGEEWYGDDEESDPEA
jgi:hypothetical protein